MIGIYKITSPSGKVYIGQSWNIERRFYTYTKGKCKDQPKLYNSFLKYGVDNHKFEVVYELPEDIEQKILDNYEILYILQYRLCGIDLLNLQEGGNNGKHSEESKRKIRDKLKGRIVSEETKQKQMGVNNPMFGRIGDKNPFYKKKHSEKTKSIIKEKRKLQIFTKESIRKGAENRKGLKQSEETIFKRSKKLKIQILQFTLDGNFIKEWVSIKEAAIFINLNASAISQNLAEKSKNSGGFIWKYKNKKRIKNIIH